MIPWYRQKTVWVCIIAVLGALGAYYTGEIEFGKLVELMGIAFGAAFMRQGVEKSKGGGE